MKETFVKLEKNIKFKKKQQKMKKKSAVQIKKNNSINSLKLSLSENPLEVVKEVLTNHTSTITRIVFFDNEKMFATASVDNTIKIHETNVKNS